MRIFLKIVRIHKEIMQIEKYASSFRHFTSATKVATLNKIDLLLFSELY